MHRIKNYKGWTKNELAHARKTLGQAAEDRPLGTGPYKALLGAGLAGVLVFAAYVVPLVLVLPAAMLYPVVAVLGLLFGLVFLTALRDLHWVDARHHHAAWAVLGLASVGAFATVIGFAETYSGIVPAQLLQQNSAVLAGLVFALGLLAPYVYESHKNSR